MKMHRLIANIYFLLFAIVHIHGGERKMAPGAFAYFRKKCLENGDKPDKSLSSLMDDPLAKSVGRRVDPRQLALEGRLKTGRAVPTERNKSKDNGDMFIACNGNEDYSSNKTGYLEFNIPSQKASITKQDDQRKTERLEASRTALREQSGVKKMKSKAKKSNAAQ